MSQDLILKSRVREFAMGCVLSSLSLKKFNLICEVLDRLDIKDKSMIKLKLFERLEYDDHQSFSRFKLIAISYLKENNYDCESCFFVAMRFVSIYKEDYKEINLRELDLRDEFNNIILDGIRLREDKLKVMKRLREENSRLRDLDKDKDKDKSVLDKISLAKSRKDFEFELLDKDKDVCARF